MPTSEKTPKLKILRTPQAVAERWDQLVTHHDELGEAFERQARKGLFCWGDPEDRRTEFWADSAGSPLMMAPPHVLAQYANDLIAEGRVQHLAIARHGIVGVELLNGMDPPPPIVEPLCTLIQGHWESSKEMFSRTKSISVTGDTCHYDDYSHEVITRDNATGEILIAGWVLAQSESTTDRIVWREVSNDDATKEGENETSIPSQEKGASQEEEEENEVGEKNDGGQDDSSDKEDDADGEAGKCNSNFESEIAVWTPDTSAYWAPLKQAASEIVPRPLVFATRRGEPETVKALLDFGASKGLSEAEAEARISLDGVREEIARLHEPGQASWHL